MDDIDMNNDEAITTVKEQPLSENESNLDDDYDLINTDAKTPGEILDDFCVKLDEINTTIPDAVIGHYMKKAGFVVNDPKLVKIISIATQKFVSDIVNDVMQHHKLKASFHKNSTTAAPAAGATSTGASTSAAGAAGNKQHKASASAAATAPATPATTLTLEDLSQVLSEYGINVKKPSYFM